VGKKLRIFFPPARLEKAKYMPSHGCGLLDKEKTSRNLNIVVQVAARKFSSLGLVWHWVALQRKGERALWDEGTAFQCIRTILNY